MWYQNEGLSERARGWVWLHGWVNHFWPAAAFMHNLLKNVVYQRTISSRRKSTLIGCVSVRNRPMGSSKQNDFKCFGMVRVHACSSLWPRQYLIEFALCQFTCQTRIWFSPQELRGTVTDLFCFEGMLCKQQLLLYICRVTTPQNVGELIRFEFVSQVEKNTRRFS